MNDVLPAHYALSEAAIVAAGLYTIAKAWPVSRWFAIGLAAVALAALIGTVRIGLGQSALGQPEFLVTLHNLASRQGALFGLGCIVGAMAVQGDRQQILPPLVGLAAAGLTVLVPAANPVLFGLFIIGGAALAYRRSPARKLLAAASFAFLISSALFSAPLRATYPGLSWHVFHVLVAVWFVLVATYVVIPRADRGSLHKPLFR